MKNKTRLIFISVGGILLLFILLIGVYPCFRPLSVKWTPFRSYTYTLYSDYAVIDRYQGNRSEVTLPDRIWGRPVTALDFECFYKNESIKAVKLPKYLEYLGNGAFSDCINLESIAGGEKVLVIGTDAFYGCNQLKDTGSLGENVEKIDFQAFCGCKALATFPFTEKLKRIGSYAFSGSGLEAVEEVNSVECMEKCVFEDTPWLAKQTEDFVIYNDILVWYQGKEAKVVIPDGVKGIAVDFKGHDEIKEIYVPSSVDYIIIRNLFDCEGVRIYIPKEVEKIGYYITSNYSEGEYTEEEKTGRIIYKETESGNVIVTTEGSPAEAYAKEFGYQCEIVEGW